MIDECKAAANFVAYPTFSVLANYFVLHIASIGLNSGDTERTQSSPFSTACAYSFSENNSDDNKTTYKLPWSRFNEVLNSIAKDGYSLERSLEAKFDNHANHCFG
jgi:hypothetical protein